MKSQRLRFDAADGWQPESGDEPLRGAQAVIAFLDPQIATGSAATDAIQAAFPGADVLSCTTGGTIDGRDVRDGIGIAIALAFDRTPTRLATADVETSADSFAAGAAIGRALSGDDLAGIFILSEGLRVNGTELVRGIREAVSSRVTITGGLAGDGADFNTTRVGANCAPREGMIAALGLYGDAVRIGHGNAGGWEEFGPKRRITRAEGNVLYELDGKPALDLYKKYLGDEAANLPSSALLFPLKIWRNGPNGTDSQDAVRTVLGIDEAEKSMTFAGDMPAGAEAQLMMGSYEKLISGAGDAAERACARGVNRGDGAIGILVSCIGRKLLLGQRIGEEIEAVGERLNGTPLAGFYSYGELSPHSASGVCELHNQTMTITLLGEA